MIDTGDWTPEERDRLLAWVMYRDPRWVRPVKWLLLTLGLTRSADRLFRWTLDRAVRRLRAERQP